MTVRRLKTYAAENGETCDYYFVGKRPALADDSFAPATEYIFDVISHSRPRFAVSVFLSAAAINAWQTSQGRDLVDPEQYAVAKMALFRALDDAEDLMRLGRRVFIGADELNDFLLQLGLD